MGLLSGSPIIIPEKSLLCSAQTLFIKSRWREYKTMHEYYYYNKEQLLASPKIPLIVMEDNPTVFKALAEEMVQKLREKMNLERQLYLFVR